MTKVLSTFLVLFISLHSQAQNISLNDVRKNFNKGVKDENLCSDYLDYLETSAKSTVENGYKGAYTMFMAKHVSNPLKKMSYFKSGKKILEQQIKSDPNNTELRFIRLCIQYHIPDYLGYNNNINQDKDFLVTNLYKMKDDKVKELIYTYLKGANMYNEEELTLLRR